ncbi:MAG TPA: zinc ABC transporter substrate-binding protein, partial [Atribacteraceae bacterium]|nr:zinc ABC transporter substrate-binding protein [Atribacteraceae bacterium]
MMRTRTIATLVMLIATLIFLGTTVTGQPAEEERIKVVVSFAVLHDFATFIGGDRVEVTTMLEFGGCPCGWEPTPGNIKELIGADIFIHLSALVDPWLGRAIAAAGDVPNLVV